MDDLRVYDVGQGGVNLVKDPILLDNSELTQAQNAEILVNEAKGALAKRGGLSALNSSPLSGAITGMLGVPLETTYTRTLYAARQTASANTFTRSTNGTSWTNTSSLTAAAANDKFQDNTNEQTARRLVSFGSFIVYPGDNYTQATTNPTIISWDGTEAYTLTSVPIGPSGNASPTYVITDALTANGIIYMAISDPGGSAPNRPGRVMSLDIRTGKLAQVAAAFGGGTGEISGGAPACLAWYKGQLWVGLNLENTTNGTGKIVRCYPTIDTTWTTDVSNLTNSVTSLLPFKGDLIACTRSSVSAGAVITKRSRTAGTWSTSATSGGGAAGSGHYASLVEYSGSVYAVEYFSGVTDILHIVSSSDGASWSTSRDVDANDSPADPPQLPGAGIVYNSDLFYVFRSTSVSATDGFIMRRSAGSWTKVLTGNLGGGLATLVDRS